MAADVANLSVGSGPLEARRLQIRSTILIYDEAGTLCKGLLLDYEIGAGNGRLQAQMHEGHRATQTGSAAKFDAIFHGQAIQALFPQVR